MKKFMFCLLLSLFLVSIAQSDVLFSENWESGNIDHTKWTLQSSSGSFAFISEVGGNKALYLQNPPLNWTDGIQSITGFDRSFGDLVCTFKVWHAGGAPASSLYTGPCGPWTDHIAPPVEQTYPMITRIEAGIGQMTNPSSPITFYQEGSVTTINTAALSTAFTNALVAAVDEATAVMVRSTIGSVSGAKLEWSTDGGSTWNVSFNTIGETGGATPSYGGSNKVSNHNPLWICFAGLGKAGVVDYTVVDDITVEGTSNATGGWLDVTDITPKGTYYDINVPDTLDLAERGRIAVRGLTNFLDPAGNYSEYGHMVFYTKPAYMYHDGGYSQNWGKTAEALILARNMCGSTENLDIELATIIGMMNYAAKLSRWETYPVPLARIMLALKALNEKAPNEQINALLDTYTQDMYDRSHQFSNYAYYGDPDYADGLLGYYLQPFTSGSVMRALCERYDMTSNPSILTFTTKLENFLVDRWINSRVINYWNAEAEPKAVYTCERGQFNGHMHGYMAGLMGLIHQAEKTNDARLKEFVRQSYEFLRNFGIARLGLFGEACATGDMTYLAIKLSDWGVGDYWEDADQYVRNQMAELQYIDAAKMQGIVNRMTTVNPPPISDPYTTDNVVNRCVGLFTSDSWNPCWIPSTGKTRLQFVVCCSGNVTKGMYQAWEGITRFKEGSAVINLLLNRASPWLDIDSYLPYEGKVVVKNKLANKLSVRIPRWVDRNSLTCKVNDANAAFTWIGNYVDIDRLGAGDVIEVNFPIVQTTEKYSLLWSESEPLWKETTDPGSVNATPDVYTCIFKGNTCIQITSSLPAPAYRYQRYETRSGYLGSIAPMVNVTRFVPDYTVNPGECITKPISDLNDDCKVDFADLAVLGNQWLVSGLAE